MLLVFSEMMGIPNPATYYTLELQPDPARTVPCMAHAHGHGAFTPRRLQMLLTASRFLFRLRSCGVLAQGR